MKCCFNPVKILKLFNYCLLACVCLFACFIYKTEVWKVALFKKRIKLFIYWILVLPADDCTCQSTKELLICWLLFVPWMAHTSQSSKNFLICFVRKSTQPCQLIVSLIFRIFLNMGTNVLRNFHPLLNLIRSIEI